MRWRSETDGRALLDGRRKIAEIWNHGGRWIWRGYGPAARRLRGWMSFGRVLRARTIAGAQRAVVREVARLYREAALDLRKEAARIEREARGLS